jgi:two-component system sensor histidine kinase YesM
MMASMQGVDNIRRMTEALNKLLLDTLGKNGELTTVEKEIENIESYAYIMKTRYGDRFDMIYNIGEDTHKLYILRLLLQPIVENSIIHGQNDAFTKIEIKIDTACYDNKLFVTISDNGAGVSQEQIEGLLK